MKNDDIPKIGVDFQSWSEFDDQLLKLDLNIELFTRRNVRVASLVILAGLLKGDHQLKQQYISLLSPFYFDPRSMARYLFEKIASFLAEKKTITIPVLESLVPQYERDVWGESYSERMFFTNNLRLRRILSLDPTEEQVNQAIALRKDVMERYGYENKDKRT